MIREKHIGIADLNAMNRKRLKSLDCAQIVHYRNVPEPAAVLIPYWMFIKITSAMRLLHDAIGEAKEDAK